MIFRVFLPYSRSCSVHFSFSTFLGFLAIFQVLQCVCVSFSTFFIFLTIFQVLQCAFVIFHVFQCFSPYSRPTVWVSHFPLLSVSLPIFEILQCAFLIFQRFQCFSTYCTFYSVHFSFFHVFQCFLPYSRSYTVCFSFATFFSVRSECGSCPKWRPGLQLSLMTCTWLPHTPENSHSHLEICAGAPWCWQCKQVYIWFRHAPAPLIGWSCVHDEVAWPTVSEWGLRAYKQTSLCARGPCSSTEAFLQ